MLINEGDIITIDGVSCWVLLIVANELPIECSFLEGKGLFCLFNNKDGNPSVDYVHIDNLLKSDIEIHGNKNTSNCFHNDFLYWKVFFADSPLFRDALVKKIEL